MKKTLITLGLAGAVLIPAGAAFADTGTTPLATCPQEQPIRARDGSGAAAGTAQQRRVGGNPAAPRTGTGAHTRAAGQGAGR